MVTLGKLNSKTLLIVSMNLPYTRPALIILTWESGKGQAWPGFANRSANSNSAFSPHQSCSNAWMMIVYTSSDF